MVCLVAAVVLPAGPLLWDLDVRCSVDALQSACDRLDALRERLAEPRATNAASLALAEDLVERRTISELLDDVQAQLRWCDGADINGLRGEFARWFADRSTPEPFLHFDGVIDAAVRRSRAGAMRSRLAVECGMLAAIVSAVIGSLALIRVRRGLDIQSAIRRAIPAPVVAAKVAEVRLRSSAPVEPTPLVTPRATLSRQSPSPAQGLSAISEPLSRLHGRVLVVEDNPINQRVTHRQLTELGLDVEVVPTAEIGLERLAQGAYDVVLMDLQLPGIDGLAATKRWRARELAEGRRRLPIVAITANALGTDREACFIAGMDGYQAKPARLDDLHRVLGRWVVAEPPSPVPDQSAPASAVQPLPSPATLLAVVADTALADPVLWDRLRRETERTDPQMLEELMADLHAQAPALPDELVSALGHVDFENLRASAHRIKGSAGMLGLPRLAACAKAIEFAAKASDAETAGLGIEMLRDVLDATFTDPGVAALL